MQEIINIREAGTDPSTPGHNAVYVHWMKGVRSKEQADWDRNLNMPVFGNIGNSLHERLLHGPLQGRLVHVSDLMCVPVAVVPHPLYFKEDSTNRDHAWFVGFHVRDALFFYHDTPQPNDYHHVFPTPKPRPPTKGVVMRS